MRIHLHDVVRSPGQKLVPVQMSKEFIEQVNTALPKLGYSDRSSFIREAIVEKLAREGIIVPHEFSLAPARVGKTRYPSHAESSASLNEKTASNFGPKDAAATHGIVAKKVEEEIHRSSPSSGAAAPTGHKSAKPPGSASHPKSKPKPPTRGPKGV